MIRYSLHDQVFTCTFKILQHLPLFVGVVGTTITPIMFSSDDRSVI